MPSSSSSASSKLIARISGNVAVSAISGPLRCLRAGSVCRGGGRGQPVAEEAGGQSGRKGISDQDPQIPVCRRRSVRTIVCWFVRAWENPYVQVWRGLPRQSDQNDTLEILGGVDHFGEPETLARRNRDEIPSLYVHNIPNFFSVTSNPGG